MIDLRFGNRLEGCRNAFHRRQVVIMVLLLLLAAGAQGASTSFPAPGPWATGITYDGNVLYVFESSGFRRIYRVDPNGGAILGVFSLPAGLGSLEFDGVDRLFVTDLGRVVEIAAYEPDGPAHTQFNTFNVPFRAKGIAFDGTNLYLHDWDSGRFMVTDRSGTVLVDTNTGRRISDMVFDPSTGTIWALEIFSGMISELATDGTALRSCVSPVGSGAYAGMTLVGQDFYISFAQPSTIGIIHVVPRADLVCDPPLLKVVDIDIKPGSEPNSINVGSNGNVPVAILSSADFDATTVDPLTVTLASGAVWLKGNGTPMASFADVDGDGRTDIVVHVATESLLLSDGDTEAVLEGETYDGIAFTGTDTVRIVPQD